MTALLTGYEDFARGYEAGQNQVVYARLAADLDTPVSLMLKLAEARKDSFILESVTGGEVRGRYSIIGLKPDLVWECQGETPRGSTDRPGSTATTSKRSKAHPLMRCACDRRKPDRPAR